MKSNIFFKKYKTIKQIILVLLIASILISISELVRGYNQGDVMGCYMNRYENYLALYNPEKYLEDDIFVVDTVFIEEHATSGNNHSTNRVDYTVIKGNLLHSKIKKEITCSYRNEVILRDYGILTMFNDASYRDIVNDKNDTTYLTKLNNITYQNINSKKIMLLKVLKNRINNVIFLEDKKYIREAKFNAVGGLCIPLFSVLLLIILLILKIKSK